MKYICKTFLGLSLALGFVLNIHAQSDKFGRVNATNVNLRNHPTTQSKVVGKLQKNEDVIILNRSRTNSDAVEAILLKDAKFYSQEGEYRFTLPKGKAVELLAFDPEADVYHVSYVNAGVKGYTKLDRTSVKTITYEQWYYIQRTKARAKGWVLARYIDLAEDVDDDSIVVYED